ncbi:MAG: hypothetical protein BJ554DRAFT_254, partial [Olpidium bornovanus]
QPAPLPTSPGRCPEPGRTETVAAKGNRNLLRPPAPTHRRAKIMVKANAVGGGAKKKRTGGGKAKAKKKPAADGHQPPPPPLPLPVVLPSRIPCRVHHVGWVFCDRVLLLPAAASVHRLQIEICEKVHGGAVRPDEVVVLRQRFPAAPPAAAAAGRSATSRPAGTSPEQAGGAAGAADGGDKGLRGGNGGAQATPPSGTAQDPGAAAAPAETIRRLTPARAGPAAGEDVAVLPDDLDDAVRRGTNAAAVFQACAEPASTSVVEFYRTDPAAVSALVQEVEAEEAQRSRSRDEWGVLLYGSRPDYEYRLAQRAADRNRSPADPVEVTRKRKKEGAAAAAQGAEPGEGAAAGPAPAPAPGAAGAAGEPGEPEGGGKPVLEHRPAKQSQLLPSARPGSSAPGAVRAHQRQLLDVYYDVRYTAASAAYTASPSAPPAASAQQPAAKPERFRVDRTSLIMFEMFTPPRAAGTPSSSAAPGGVRRAPADRRKPSALHGGWVAGM